MSLPLSQGIIYYVRKLLRQNLDRLEPVLTNGQMLRKMQFDGTSDLENALEVLYPSLGKRMAAIQEIERLAIVHQTLSTSSASTNRTEIETTEAEIYAKLGFRLGDPEGKGRVLVVDDVPTNLNLLSNALKQQGYQVNMAASGKEAIAAVAEALPDVILLDIMMPDMDGYAVCDHLKKAELLQDIPIIFVSAVHDAASKVRAFTSGGADYVTKPFQLEEVLARVENQMRLRQLQKRLEAQNLRLEDEMRDRERAEARYRGLFENALEPMFQADFNGRFLAVNTAFAKLYGYESAAAMMELVSDIGIQVYADPKRLMELLKQLQQQDQVIGAESQMCRYDDSEIRVVENIRVVKNVQGEPVYYEGSVQAISPVLT
jgi:adenylate cyclase